MDLGDEELLRDEAVWMGTEAIPRALAEIERLNLKLEAIARALDINHRTKPSHDPRMAADLFGGAAEIPGLCSRIARAQAEVDDLTQALREHPDARDMDLSEFLVSATAGEIRKACAKVGIRSDIFFTAMMSKEDKPAPPEAVMAKLRRETFERIAALPKMERHRAAKRASRSFSVPESCVEQEGCRIEGAEMVWPDGERYPTRPEEPPGSPCAICEEPTFTFFRSEADEGKGPERCFACHKRYESGEPHLSECFAANVCDPECESKEDL